MSWWWLILLLILILVLAGCAGGPKPETRLAPACSALIGPIHYNSYVPKSRRYAGPDLAPDLKRRNQVGTYLGCPQYRRY
jgi:hypothetical protein